MKAYVYIYVYIYSCIYIIKQFFKLFHGIIETQNPPPPTLPGYRICFIPSHPGIIYILYRRVVRAFRRVNNRYGPPTKKHFSIAASLSLEEGGGGEGEERDIYISGRKVTTATIIYIVRAH